MRVVGWGKGSRGVVGQWSDRVVGQSQEYGTGRDGTK